MPKLRPRPKHSFNIYVPPAEQDLVERTNKLAKKIRVSPSRIILVSLNACLDTLEIEAPVHREVMLNGCRVIV